MCPPLDESLHTPLAPAKTKKHRPVKIVGYVLASLVLAYGLYIGGTIAYFNLAYDLPIFINGASMFPYLNADAERYENGTYRPYRYLDGTSTEGDKVDYGYAKSRDRISILNEVKRFDVVTTYYPSDYATNTDGSLKRDANGKLILNMGAYPKIKRVIALPNEKLEYKIVTGEGDENGNPIWGETRIDGNILKPLYTVADYHIQDGGYNYPSSSYAWAKTADSFSITLGEKEYLVAGDNRGYSSDGLSKRFAVLEEMIQGKVYFIVGKSQMKATAEGNQISADYSFVFAPWRYRRIG